MSEKSYKPVKTNKVGGSPFTGVLGWIDDRLPLPRILLKEFKLSLQFWWHINA